MSLLFYKKKFSIVQSNFCWKLFLTHWTRGKLQEDAASVVLLIKCVWQETVHFHCTSSFFFSFALQQHKTLIVGFFFKNDNYAPKSVRTVRANERNFWHANSSATSESWYFGSQTKNRRKHSGRRFRLKKFRGFELTS